MPTDRQLYDEHQRDQADDDLQRIVDNKLALQESLDAMQRAFPQIDDLAMRAACEEVYDDTYHDEWHRLTGISGGVTWPTEIPPFGALDFDSPKHKADRAWKKAHPLDAAMQRGADTARGARLDDMPGLLPRAALGMVNPHAGKRSTAFQAGSENHD